LETNVRYGWSPFDFCIDLSVRPAKVGHSVEQLSIGRPTSRRCRSQTSPSCHGAVSAWIVAEPGFARRVLSKFRERCRVTPAQMDPLRLRSQWLEHYFELVNGIPFAICEGGDTGTSAVSSPRRAGHDKQALEWTLRIDIGGNAVKVVVLYRGADVKGEAQVLTRVDAPDYDSASLGESVRAAVQAAAATARIYLAEIQACALSWPGALRQGKAAASKTLLNMRDVLSTDHPNVERFAEVRNLAIFLRSVLGLRLDPRSR
jgi:hypothetical protein